MNTSGPRSLVLFDIDDVLCMNEPWGCLHVRDAFRWPAEAPPHLLEQLFRSSAVEALNELLEMHKPKLVITSAWLSMLDRQHFETVFSRTGLPWIATNLHQFWDAPTNRGEDRLTAVERWLRTHHRGQQFLVLDDYESGASLVGSKLHQQGRVVLCEPGTGFTSALLPAADQALRAR